VIRPEAPLNVTAGDLISATVLLADQYNNTAFSANRVSSAFAHAPFNANGTQGVATVASITGLFDFVFNITVASTFGPHYAVRFSYTGSFGLQFADSPIIAVIRKPHACLLQRHASALTGRVNARSRAAQHAGVHR
jgi:hypothetical protein